MNSFCGEVKMKSRIQQLAVDINMPCDEFFGEMRKLGCCQPTVLKIWLGEYEESEGYQDEDVDLSTLHKAAYVLKVQTGILISKIKIRERSL
jgi:hypothetical protein